MFSPDTRTNVDVSYFKTTSGTCFSMIKTAFLGFLLATMTLLTGCATNQITGRTQVTIGSEETLIAETAQGYANMKAQFAAQRMLITSGPVKARVEGITNRLIEQAVKYRPDAAAWDWEVIVINGKDINAFAMPGGKMGIFTGIINVPLTDDEIAQIMGHEIGHALAKHGLEKKTTRTGAGVLASIGGALLGQGGVPVGQDAAALGAMGFIVAPNSRTAESEADRFGIELAAAAGYDPKAAVTLWEKMAALGSPSQKGFLDTHPTDTERVSAMVALQEPMTQIRMQSLGLVSNVNPEAAKTVEAPTAKGKKAPRPALVRQAVAKPTLPPVYDWLNGPKDKRPDVSAEAPKRLYGVK